MENANFQKQLKVGVFILLGITIFISSIFLLGGDSALFKSTYTLRLRMPSVQGLVNGSVISLAGLTVGNVASIDFVDDVQMLEVVMTIDRKYQKRITQGSLADIRTQGALGDKYVYVTPGPPNAIPIADNGEIEAEKETDVLGMISQRAGDLEKVFMILDEVHKFTQVLNRDNRAEKMMANMSQAMAEVKVLARDGRSLVSDLRSESSLAGAMNRLETILEKIERGDGTIGQLINDPALHTRIKSFLGGSSRSENTNSLLRSAIQKKEEVRGQTRPAPTPRR